LGRDALKMLGSYDEAIKCYNKALKIDPDYEQAIKAKNELLSEIS